MAKSDQERINAAEKFAAEKHKGQTRIGGDPYISHPMAVAQIIKEQGYGTDYQIAALFHEQNNPVFSLLKKLQYSCLISLI